MYLRASCHLFEQVGPVKVSAVIVDSTLHERRMGVRTGCSRLAERVVVTAEVIDGVAVRDEEAIPCGKIG